MKWSGQNIYDLISRFRNDVYLEDISTGTIASGAHLGLDSNNKIVKATDGGGDLTSIIAGTGLSGTDLTGPIPTLNVDASQTQITGVGTITTGVWNGTAISATYLDGQSGTNTGDETLASINALNITRIGTITAGVWNGTAIASAYLDADTAHLSGTQTFTGTKTFDNTISGAIDGQAATVATIAGLAPNTATTQATQPSITTLAGVTAIGTASNTLIFTNDIVRFDSANANDPLVLIKNSANDATSGRFRFLNERGADGQDDDETGIIEFFSYDDGTPAGERYARIIGTIHDATAGQESGKLSLQVASHDGGDEDGLVLTGGSADAEVDVTIGNGAASVTTLAGTLTMGSTAAMTNAGLLSVANQSGITGLGTISSGVWNGTKITDVYTNSSGKRFGSTIKILPSDFMINEDAASPLSFKDGSNSGVHVNDTASEAIAFVTIPEGMKATHVDVYGTHNKTLKVWAPDLNASFDFTGSTIGTGAMNTQLDITDTNATATNYLAIQLTLTATSQRIWGGIVTIAAQ